MVRTKLHNGKVAGAAAEVGDENQLPVIDATLVVISGGHRLGKKMHLFEAGLAQRNGEARQGKLLVGAIFGAAKVNRPADYQSTAEIAQSILHGLPELPQQYSDQFFKRVRDAEELRLVE